MNGLTAFLTVSLLLAAGASVGCAQSGHASGNTRKVQVDTVSAGSMSESDRYNHLTEADFEKVAAELDVETAAIKAVVAIEAGAQMKGFWAPGVPVINFDRSMYLKYASKAASRAGAKGESVPPGLSGYARSEWSQLITARRNNAQGANMGTFWGMFQIGGFNYKVCGCESVDEFVRLMSYSELEQLELFASFLVNTGCVKDLRAKNWAAFARRYNGPSYARRGYHTKMAAAYAKFKAQEVKSTSHNGRGSATSGDARLAGKELKISKNENP